MQRVVFSVIVWFALALGLSACSSAVIATPTAARSAIPSPSPAPTHSATAVTQPATTPTSVGATTYPVILQDDHQRSVPLNRRPERIVSLAPSCTETLYAVGAGDRIVGVDKFSNYPAEAKSKPKVGGLKANLEEILALRPDLVCAAGITPADTVQALAAAKVPVLVLDAKTIDGVLADITLAGTAVDGEASATRTVSEVRARIQAVQEKVAGAPRPRVFHELDATDPAKPYTVGPGSFVDQLIGAAGGQNAFATARSAYPQVNLEEILRADPQIIILADAAYGVTTESVMRRPGWGEITAVKRRAIYPIDPDLVSRPGPRIAAGVEELARIIHPDRFPAP